MPRFTAIFVLGLVALALCQEIINPETTQASSSSDAPQPTEASSSSDAQPTEASSSSDAQPTEASSSSDAQPTEASSSSDAQPTEASSSSDAQPTEASSSSEAQPTEVSSSSDAQTTQASSSSDASQPTEASSSSDAQTTQASSSSDAQTTKASSSSDAQTSKSSSKSPSTTAIPDAKSSTEICQRKYPNSVVRAIQMSGLFGDKCTARCALVKKMKLFNFKMDFIRYIDDDYFTMFDGESCDPKMQCLNSKCTSNQDIETCKSKTSKPMSEIKKSECQLKCKNKDGTTDVVNRSGGCGLLGYCENGHCEKTFWFKK